MCQKLVFLILCGICQGQVIVITTGSQDNSLMAGDTAVPESEISEDDSNSLVVVLPSGSVNEEDEQQQEQVFPGFNDLSEFRWQNRLVLVFAPTQDSSLLKQQRQIIDCNSRGYSDRSLRVIEVIGSEVRLDGVLIDNPPASELRVRYGVLSDSFRSILIGLDGGSKLSTSSVLTADYLFDEIDAMPMRRQQIQSQGFAVPSISNC